MLFGLLGLINQGRSFSVILIESSQTSNSLSEEENAVSGNTGQECRRSEGHPGPPTGHALA